MNRATSVLRSFAGGVIAVVSLSIVAGCGGGGGGGGGGTMPGPQPSQSAQPAFHINFFGSANGTLVAPTFGTISGFTQQQHAQVLGIAPGAQIIVTNNDSVAHTFNVFAGAFPTPGPQDTTAAPNGGVLGPGYRSGVLAPGQSTSMLTLTSTAGNLFIICGIHFSSGMKDGLVVQVGATPGPQATPNPTGTGGCHGYGC